MDLWRYFLLMQYYDQTIIGNGMQKKNKPDVQDRKYKFNALKKKEKKRMKAICNL